MPSLGMTTAISNASHATGNFIDKSRHLGVVSKCGLDTLPEAPPKETYPDRGAGRADILTKTYFGLFLPHGVQLEDFSNAFQDLHEAFYTHLNDLELAYERFFDIQENERFSMAYQKNEDIDVRDWQPTPSPS